MHCIWLNFKVSNKGFICSELFLSRWLASFLQEKRQKEIQINSNKFCIITISYPNVGKKSEKNKIIKREFT